MQKAIEQYCTWEQQQHGRWAAHLLTSASIHVGTAQPAGKGYCHVIWLSFCGSCVLLSVGLSCCSVLSGKNCLLGRYPGNGAGARCGRGSAAGEICAPVPEAKGGTGNVAPDPCVCSSGQTWVCAPGSGPQKGSGSQKPGYWDALYSVLGFPPCSLLVPPQLGLCGITAPASLVPVLYEMAERHFW